MTELADEKGTVKVVVAGREVEISSDSRILSQLKNIETQQAEEKFKEARDSFAKAAGSAVDEAMPEGDNESLEGMTLVYELSGDKGPEVVDSRKVTIKQRLPKAQGENGEAGS